MKHEGVGGFRVDLMKMGTSGGAGAGASGKMKSIKSALVCIGR